MNGFSATKCAERRLSKSVLGKEKYMIGGALTVDSTFFSAALGNTPSYNLLETQTITSLPRPFDFLVNYLVHFFANLRREW